MLRVAALLALVACSDVKTLCGGCGIDATFLPGIGQVFQCQTADQTLELCYDGEASDLAQSLTDNGFGDAHCGATPRHAGVCYFHCGSGRGCNAFGGCWCGDEP